ncbi:hypothetical protein C8R44DRAFT_740887 [Mycena epipterygia]|nr:hypothetical protein C8R44DRAFT_740887 [Mycena epipterygia]
MTVIIVFYYYLQTRQAKGDNYDSYYRFLLLFAELTVNFELFDGDRTFNSLLRVTGRSIPTAEIGITSKESGGAEWGGDHCQTAQQRHQCLAIQYFDNNLVNRAPTMWPHHSGAKVEAHQWCIEYCQMWETIMPQEHAVGCRDQSTSKFDLQQVQTTDHEVHIP